MKEPLELQLPFLLQSLDRMPFVAVTSEFGLSMTACVVTSFVGGSVLFLIFHCSSSTCCVMRSFMRDSSS